MIARTVSGLLRFSGARECDPAIEQWFDERPGALGAIARRWFARMRRCGVDVRELLHDGCPVVCVDEAPFAYVDAFTAHVNVGFFHGDALADPAGLLQGSGRFMRHVKAKPGAALDASSLETLIDAAYVDIVARVKGGPAGAVAREAGPAFAIKAEVREPEAETFEFAAQKTMYGGKHIAVGDTIFVFASENEGGGGLVACGVVTAANALARKRGVARQTPRVGIAVRRTARAKRRLGRGELRPFSDWGDGRPETELNFKFYRQATNKIVGLSPQAAAFLRGYF